MDLSHSDSQDSFTKFMDASNEDEESLTLNQQAKSLRNSRGGGPGGYGDMQRSQQFNSSNRSGGGMMGMGSSYGSASGGMGINYDPYDIDLDALPKQKPVEALPKQKTLQLEPQTKAQKSAERKARFSTNKLAASSSSSGTRAAGKQGTQSDERNMEFEEASDKSPVSRKRELAPVDEGDKAEFSDSESASASVPHANETDAAKGGTGSIFASMLSDFQKSVASSQQLAEELEEERTRKKEEEERLREEERKKLEEEEKERRRKEEEEKIKKEEEERQREEEKRRNREEEEKRKQEEEERLRKQEEEDRRRREDERRKQEDEATKRYEEKRREEERRQQEEELLRKQREEETLRKKEEEARIKSEDERRRRLEEAQRAETEQRGQGEMNSMREAEERKRLEAAVLLQKQDQERRLEEVRNEEQRKQREDEQASFQKAQEERQARHVESNVRGEHAVTLSTPSLETGQEEERTRRHVDMVSTDGRAHFFDGSPRNDKASNHSETFSRQRTASGDQNDMRPPATPPTQSLRPRSLSETEPRGSEAGGYTPRPQAVEAKIFPRPAFPNASAGSGPLMASVVRDSMGSLPGFSAAAPLLGSRPEQLPHDDEVWRLPCDDGKLLVLKSTESAEMEEKLAFFRAHGLDHSGIHDTSAPAGSPTFDVTASLLLDPSVNSSIMASAGIMRPSASPPGVSQRFDRAKLENLQAEIECLRKKVGMLEVFNTDLANGKARAEAESVRLGEQLMWLGLEKADATKSKSAALKEAALGRHELEQKLHMYEGKHEEQATSHACDAAAAKRRQEELETRVAALLAENGGLREECATLKEDLFGAPVGLQERRAPGTGGSDRGSEGGDSQGYGQKCQRLNSELEMAETMLRGAEKENENLAQQNRQLRQSARLRKEEIDGRQLQLVSELNAARASADTNPASMRRVSEMERELMTAKERCDEMAKELERCREAKRQLERELLNGPQAVPSAETSAQLAEAVSERGRLDAEVKLLRDKVDWYVQSQHEMEDDRRNAVRLGEEVRTLRTENTELKRRPGSKETGRRAAELQKQVDQLQDCLRKRNPDSILNLMKACEPKPEEKKELRTLTAKVDELEVKLTERDETYDRQVRALRAHYDHLRLEYEKRTTIGGDTGATEGGGAAGREETRRAAPDREAVLKARIQDLERQVEHTKSYYLTKLRKREPLVPPKANRTSKNASTEHREMELHMEIRERDSRIEALSKELHFRTMDEAARPLESSPGNFAPAQVTSSSHSTPSPSSLRMFLGSPEAPPIVALSAELRAMGHSERLRRYDEIASQARHMVTMLTSEEAAAGVLANSEPNVSPPGRNVLRLHSQPSLPATVWSIWRKLAEEVGALAAEVSLRSENGSTGGEGMHSAVACSLAKFRGSVETILFNLIFSPAGLSNLGWHLEAWGPETRVLVESLLPRILVERICEDLYVAGTGHVVAALQDVEVHADADGILRWSELEGVLARCGVGGPRLVDECRTAAHPDWTLSLSELKELLKADGGQRPWQAPCSNLIRTLTRVRLVLADHDPALPLLFRSLDVAGRGFVSRPEFMEALRGIHCALSPEERVQLAVFFSPAVDPRFVCYPLFLQCIVPTQGEGMQLTPTWPEGMLRPNAGRWAEPVAALSGAGRPAFPSTAHFDAAARASELEVANSDLRERVRTLTERCAENAAVAAQSPAHVVRRLQGEMAALETRMLEQQTALSAGSRKAEITLRGELDVSRHEVASLRQALEAKEGDVERYKQELEAIIGELIALKSLSNTSS